MKKRSLFTIIILVAVSGLVLSSLNSCTKAPKKNIGLQLYSLRDSIRNNVPVTLEKVSKMGYTFVELAGYRDGMFYGMAPAGFKALCDKNKLLVLSSHMGSQLPDSAGWNDAMAWWDTCIEAHAAVGVKYMIQPSIGGNAYQDINILKGYCSYFNAIGEKCKAKGIKFGYHNHDKEFSTLLEGQPVYDIMLNNTDPSLVTFEMDLYWTVVGGANPFYYFNK